MKRVSPLSLSLASVSTVAKHCDKEQPLIEHGYCKRWGILIKGYPIFIIDIKREYRLASEVCGAPYGRTRTLRLREIRASVEMIQLYIFMGIFPLIWIVQWLFF